MVFDYEFDKHASLKTSIQPREQGKKMLLYFE